MFHPFVVSMTKGLRILAKHTGHGKQGGGDMQEEGFGMGIGGAG